MFWRVTYAYSYRFGHTPWDTGVTPPEVVERIEGTDALAPGRALDLGCGTGTNVRYLATHGWEATGVEADGRAVAAALEKVESIDGARILRGDVTRLEELPLSGSFDLVLDIGCFHSVHRRRRDAYARGVARLTASGAVLFIWAFATGGPMRPLGVTPREMRDRFAPWFEPVGRIAGQHPPGAAWYLLRRTDAVAP